MWAAMPPHQRKARSKGVPSLGAGAIYPVDEEEFTVDDFEIPDHWLRFNALDVGWNATACGFFAWDREADCLYIYGVHKQGEEKPPVHAAVIKARGNWIPGVIDPAARGRSQRDGEKLMDEYVALGLDLSVADNSVESGILKVFMRLISGRLKVFRSCSQWFEEFRVYRRDEKGKIVKANDHLMDITRYGVASGTEVAITEPAKRYIEDKERQADDEYDLFGGLK